MVKDNKKYLRATKLFDKYIASGGAEKMQEHKYCFGWFLFNYLVKYTKCVDCGKNFKAKRNKCPYCGKETDYKF